MDERVKPVMIGLAAGVLSLALPGSLGPVVIVAAALLAGWVLPGAPLVAAFLFLAPTAVVGAVRLLMHDDHVSGSVLGFAVVSAVMLTAIFTHVGAALAIRRRTGST